MGVDLDVRPRQGAEDPEEYGDVLVKGGVLKGTVVREEEISNLIDELPLVAVLGALAHGETEIRGAQELRLKESDRIACMVANLRIFGVDVQELEDGMIVRGEQPLAPQSHVQSYGDHRVAMAMAILALYAKSPTCISDTDCVQTSYPTFWADLAKVGVYVE